MSRTSNKTNAYACMGGVDRSTDGRTGHQVASRGLARTTEDILLLSSLTLFGSALHYTGNIYKQV